MGRPFILHYDDNHCIHCRICKTQVGFMRDHLCTSMGYEVYIFDNVFNVEVPEDKRYQKVEKDGRTMNDTYCVKCGNLIGWKVIAVDKPWIIVREGVFLMDIHNVDLTNQGGVNEQAANVQEGDANEQGGANEQNDEQEGDANEDVDLLAEGIANVDLNPNI
ncbi:protein yippee-like At3g08990 [Solanum pennellii]|uniref:Protein yippee-like n=1 Tax=Solanum pennellii TaxID=28526 RepID=A0ABM1H2S0_SOLPN|nr:protein yippee-like At3g08990 [Solanum pennellii]